MRATHMGLIVVAGLLGIVIGYLAMDAINGGGGGETRMAAAELSDTEFAERVREAMVRNPDILQEAFAALETQSRAAEIAELQDAVTRNLTEIETAPAAIIGGNPMGDVTIIEFFDYECPYCARALPAVNDMMETDGNIRFIYFEVPILGETSYNAAVAAVASQRQGLYEPFHNLLMASGERLTDDVIMTLAEEAGLDTEQLQEDMSDERIEQRLRANMQLAQALGVNSTPTFVVNGQVVIGWREDQVRALLAEARE